MITFYPGPSKVYPQVEMYLQDAFRTGILSANHRSKPFMKMLQTTLALFKEKLEVPSDYEVYFVSSATECWEIISQSLVLNSSFHIYNGAFGAKWLEYAKKIRTHTKGVHFDFQQSPTIALLNQSSEQDEVICITHNETSNGTELPAAFMSELRKATPKLIAVDATSSMGGTDLNWADADIWFASVQKCLGLPPGMGVLVVSPNAIEHAAKIQDRSYYNSLLFIKDNFNKFQTPYTPNTLSIYLLGEVLKQVNPISEVAERIHRCAASWYDFLLINGYELLVKNALVRSKTVVAVEGIPAQIAEIKSNALEVGIVLGNGYGDWKENCFRLANFPAISDEEINVLKRFLEKVDSK
jgi:phosphoserine aminotransferase